MKRQKNCISLLMIGLLFLSMTACNDDNAENSQKEIGIELPGTFTMVYGEEQDIALPSNILGASDLKITLDFSLNENVKVNANEYLNDKLSKAVTINKESGKINVKSALLYSNSAVSNINGVKLPDSYKIIVSASSVSQNFQGKETIQLKITPSTLSIKGLDNKATIPVTYIIYGDAANFELVPPQNLSADMTWAIENKSSIGKEVSLSSNILKFAANTGDSNKKDESSYNVTPVLLKDGFRIASKTIRVIYIPKIKFFFGTYYPEQDLTIVLNSLFIGLSNEFVSAAPALYPESYKSTFSITGIKKDNQAFTDTDSIFSINEKTGSISVKKNTSLTQGAYEITVKALTTTGLEFLTTLTLKMEEMD